MKDQNQNQKKKTPEPSGKKSKETIRDIHHYHNGDKAETTNFGGLFLGILVVFVGLIVLAKTIGWIDINLDINWWRFWPVLIIVIGLSMFSGRGWVFKIIGILLALIILGIVCFLLFNAINFKSPDKFSYDKTISGYFEQVDSNNYKSNNYLISDKKVDIVLDLGVSRLNIG